MESTVSAIRALNGVLDLAPVEGSEFPSIAWGDHFFYYAPDAQVPQHEQPFATVVTKNYPDDDLGQLDDPGRWRLNVHVGRARLAELLGDSDDDIATVDFAAADTFMPHPVYRSQGWVAIINPTMQSAATVDALLVGAHADARRRFERRATS